MALLITYWGVLAQINYCIRVLTKLFLNRGVSSLSGIAQLRNYHFSAFISTPSLDLITSLECTVPNFITYFSDSVSLVYCVLPFFIACTAYSTSTEEGSGLMD